MIPVIRELAGLDPFRGCVFVPTMGALHEGHAALISLAAGDALRRGAGVVVSVFVNPTQFDSRRDFERYPHTLDADAALVAHAVGGGGGKSPPAAVFAPAPDVIYPPGADVPVPPLPSVATGPGLEDADRPGHFAGVCQVVRRLFELVRPSAAVFGEKDWQQLQVVRAMTAAQGLGVEILAGPTVRDPDGLALSSRNVFLSAEDRERARSLFAALCAVHGGAPPLAAEARMRSIIEIAGLDVEYAVVRDAETLMPAPTADNGGRAMRSLVAARAGGVRLIDNGPFRRA